MREYDTGATRNNAEDKPNYEGFLSPLVLEEFGRYMHQHRHQADGKLRDGDNWQKGIPDEDYIDSLLRHVMDVWLHHRGYSQRATEDLRTALCATLFNAQGLLFNYLRDYYGYVEDEDDTLTTTTTDPSLPCAVCGGDFDSGHQRFCPIEIERARLKEEPYDFDREDLP